MAELPVGGENKRATRSMPCYRGSRDGFRLRYETEPRETHAYGSMGFASKRKRDGNMPGLLNAMEGFCVIGIVIGVGYVAARMRIGGPSAQMVLNGFSFFVSSRV